MSLVYDHSLVEFLISVAGMVCRVISTFLAPQEQAVVDCMLVYLIVSVNISLQ